MARELALVWSLSTPYLHIFHISCTSTVIELYIPSCKAKVARYFWARLCLRLDFLFLIFILSLSPHYAPIYAVLETNHTDDVLSSELSSTVGNGKRGKKNISLSLPPPRSSSRRFFSFFFLVCGGDGFARGHIIIFFQNKRIKGIY